MLKFKFRVTVADAETLFDILPSAKLLTYNMPINTGRLVDANFATIIEPEELTKLVQRIKNGPALMDSLKPEDD